MLLFAFFSSYRNAQNAADSHNNIAPQQGGLDKHKVSKKHYTLVRRTAAAKITSPCLKSPFSKDFHHKQKEQISGKTVGSTGEVFSKKEQERKCVIVLQRCVYTVRTYELGVKNRVTFRVSVKADRNLQPSATRLNDLISLIQK